MKTASLTAALAMAFALGSQAVAQSSDKEEYYPERGLKNCHSGRTVVQCVVMPDGKLSNCAILSETPLGDGFGDATLQVTHLWRIRPYSADGKPTSGGVFRRTVVWMPPTDCGATWLNPSGMRAYYPEAALRADVGGRATAQCDVSSDGRPKNCKILSETPLGYGFGDATVRMYQTGLRMLVTPEIARGGAVITRMVVWTPPPSPTPAPAIPPAKP